MKEPTARREDNRSLMVAAPKDPERDRSRDHEGAVGSETR